MTEVPKGLRETRKMAQETKVGCRWQRMPRKEDRSRKKAWKKKNKGPVKRYNAAFLYCKN